MHTTDASNAPVARITVVRIKLIHTLIFWILSASVLYALFSGVMNHITPWTWVAVGLVVLEGVVLVASGWTCPLTLLAERLGAVRGSVADIPPEVVCGSDLPICGTTYLVALVVIILRVFW